MMKFSDMVEPGYFMYMAEAEGYDDLVNTREAKINAVIKECAVLVREGINPTNEIDDILYRHDLTIDMLTDEECDRISRLGR